MNCSFSLLSLSSYLQSFGLTLKWPTHSSACSFSSVTSLQHWSTSIVSLCWGLNFSFSSTDSLELIFLHFSYSMPASVWTNLSLSCQSQFIIISTFSFSSIKNMFLRSISKYLNLLYLSCTFQWKTGHLIVCPLVLGTACAVLLACLSYCHYSCFGSLICCLCYGLCHALLRYHLSLLLFFFFKYA